MKLLARLNVAVQPMCPLIIGYFWGPEVALATAAFSGVALFLALNPDSMFDH